MAGGVDDVGKGETNGGAGQQRLTIRYAVNSVNKREATSRTGSQKNSVDARSSNPENIEFGPLNCASEIVAGDIIGGAVVT